MTYEVGRILVCGGRDYGMNMAGQGQHEQRLLREALDQHNREHPVAVLIHGGAKGADTLAHEWGISRQVPLILCYPAQWSVYGNAAGPIRNQAMLREAKPQWVIAARGGSGTRHMVNIATEAGVPVIFVGWN